MTQLDGFDRTLIDWLDEQAGHGVPGYLDEALARTIRTRQRPWWSSRERWLPMQTTLRFAPAPRIAWLLVVIGLIVAVGAAALWVGSRQRLPAPFGPARNGAIVSSHDGDIYAVDSATHAERLLVAGETFDFGPAFSRDGTKLMFLRGAATAAGDAQGLSLAVANADGTAIRVLTPYVQGLDWADWSPDSRQIAFLSRKTAKAPGVINVVNVDGTGLTTLDVGRPAHFLSWLPPLGREIVFRAGQDTPMESPPGIWAVHPDGTGLRQISTRPATDEFDYGNLAVAPDGSEVSYSASGPVAEIHVLDLRTGVDRVLPAPEVFTQQWGTASFSPDGRQIGYVRGNHVNDAFQFVVAPADGSGTGTPLGPSVPYPSGDINWIFTPDGSAVVVDYGEEGVVRMLPIDGSPGSVLTRGDLSFADIQRLAP
ncbi:MAG: TolB family protein [Chloroflexota bacterium]